MRPAEFPSRDGDEEFHFGDVGLLTAFKTLNELCEEHRSTEFPISN
jgi:hypothetical protein